MFYTYESSSPNKGFVHLTVVLPNGINKYYCTDFSSKTGYSLASASEIQTFKNITGYDWPDLKTSVIEELNLKIKSLKEILNIYTPEQKRLINASKLEGTRDNRPYLPSNDSLNNVTDLANTKGKEKYEVIASVLEAETKLGIDRKELDVLLAYAEDRVLNSSTNAEIEVSYNYILSELDKFKTIGERLNEI